MKNPRLIMHNQVPIDGRLTFSPNCLLVCCEKRWQELSKEEDPVGSWMEVHKPQVILEGSGSFVTDEAKALDLPEPNENEVAKLYEHYLPTEVIGREHHKGFLAVVDSRGRVRWQYKEFPTGNWLGYHLLVVVAQSTPASYLAYLRQETIPYLVAGKESVDLKEMVKLFGTQCETECILYTGGGRLGSALLAEKLIDEINIDFLPAIIGGQGTPSLFNGPPLKEEDKAVGLHLISATVQDSGKVRLRYKVDK